MMRWTPWKLKKTRWIITRMIFFQKKNAMTKKKPWWDWRKSWYFSKKSKITTSHRKTPGRLALLGLLGRLLGLRWREAQSRWSRKSSSKTLVCQCEAGAREEGNLGRIPRMYMDVYGYIWMYIGLYRFIYIYIYIYGCIWMYVYIYTEYIVG